MRSYSFVILSVKCHMNLAGLECCYNQTLDPSKPIARELYCIPMISTSVYKCITFT